VLVFRFPIPHNSADLNGSLAILANSSLVFALPANAGAVLAYNISVVQSLGWGLTVPSFDLYLLNATMYQVYLAGDVSKNLLPYRLNKNLSFIYDQDVWIDQQSFPSSDSIFYLAVDNSDIWSIQSPFGAPCASPPALSSLTIQYDIQLTTYPTPVLEGECNTRFVHNSFVQYIFINTTSLNYYVSWTSLCYYAESSGFDDTSNNMCVSQFLADPMYTQNLLLSQNFTTYESFVV
jgi:hypothetical protein